MNIKQDYFLLILLTLLAVTSTACREQSTHEEQPTITDIQQHQSSIDSLAARVDQLAQENKTLKALLSDDRVGIWGTKWNDERGESDLVFVEQLEDTTSFGMIVSAFNRHYPASQYPGIEMIDVRDRTAFVRVLDAELLTQRMGTLGAAGYLASATFSLTSLRGVEGVNFDFPEGDHAQPGLYTRASWLRVFGYL